MIVGATMDFGHPHSNVCIAYLLGRYPTVSNPFVYREIALLRSVAADVEVYALSQTTDPDHGILSPQAVNWVPTAHSVVRSDRIPPAMAQKWMEHGGRKKDLRRAAWLARQWRKRGVRVVHTHFLGFSAALAAVACSVADIPLVVTVHARGILVPTGMAMFAVEHAHSVVTISEHTRELVQERGGRCSAVVPISIDPHAVTPSTDGPIHVLTVARSVAKKGYPVMRSAMEHLPVPHAWTVIGATEDEVGGPMPGLTAYGKAHFQAVASCYEAGVDVFALACQTAPDGDEDGVPVVLLEAMARGVCVVTTPVGGVSELITHGHNGLLVPAEDPEAMSRALELLARNPRLRQRLGENGRRHVRDTRRPDEHAERLLSELCRAAQDAPV